MTTADPRRMVAQLFADEGVAWSEHYPHPDFPDRFVLKLEHDTWRECIISYESNYRVWHAELVSAKSVHSLSEKTVRTLALRVKEDL